jgi:hypothetical protein
LCIAKDPFRTLVEQNDTVIAVNGNNSIFGDLKYRPGLRFGQLILEKLMRHNFPANLLRIVACAQCARTQITPKNCQNRKFENLSMGS